VVQQQQRQRLGILYAHAAVAFGADGLSEQILLRGVVHVDVVFVGEYEFHRAQHVVGSGRLE
jgi:hypothetical protein